MSRLLIETAQDNSIRVNEGQRTARCILITEGLGNLRDKNLYLADAVESAVRVFEGAQAYLDHPSSIDEDSRPERSVRDLIGWFSDCAMTTVRDPNTGDKLAALVATLHFTEAEPGEIAYQQVRAALAYRKQFPDSKSVFCGLSINAGGLSEEAEVPGLGTVNAVHEITDVFSCDLVTKPARGGTFLGLSESYKAPVRFGGARVKESRAAEQVRLTLEAQKRMTPQERRAALLWESYRGAVQCNGVPIAYSDKFLGFSEADAHAGKVLGGMIAKVEALMDQVDEDPDEDGDLDLDELPMDSIQDDLEHKKSVRRSMGKPEPHDEAIEDGEGRFVVQTEGAATAGPTSPPPQRDAWEDEATDPAMDQPGGDEEAEGGRRGGRRAGPRSRHESAATRHFLKTYKSESGAGDGMAGADSTRTTPEIGEPDEDGKLDKSASEVNYKYALDPARSCGRCVHLQRGEDGTLGCELVQGVVRLVDSCNLFEEDESAAQTFRDEYEDGE